MGGDYKPAEREPICPLYLTALPPSRGLAALQLLFSLFPGIVSLNQLTSSFRTRIEKLPEQRLLCLISGSTKVTVGPPGALSSTFPVLFSQIIDSWEFALTFLPPLTPKSNHHSLLLLPSKYIFCFIYFLGPCD